ncbi:hypothetical protein OG474_00595 [Kribbella sp. NBC_01505]|uniref:effector-associated constant component EACC1 n=1 Tax=Kribbella sp. NBC_01505 TaxID=2903580 RepID=UPI00386583D8
MDSGIARITIDGAEEELRSLANWLRDEDDLRGQVRLDGPPIQEGQMGGALDAIVTVLTSTTVATLIISIREWATAKRSATKVTLKLKAADGRELELTAGSAADAEVTLDSARKFLDESS